MSLKLFNEIGEPNVTTTTIAEEMEISPGNLYYHFRNKDDIINSIFAQFEQQIERRLRFPEDHRPTIDETWSYLQYMADFMWTYRFLYRDLNDLLARNRTLETHFKQIISHKVRFARDMCELLVSDAEMVATPAEIEVIATNMAVISTYWLSYQYVMHPRKYNRTRSARNCRSACVISVMAPYLRGRSRQLFDDLVSGKLPKRQFTDYLPPRSPRPPTAPSSPGRHPPRIPSNEGCLCLLRLVVRRAARLCRRRARIRPRARRRRPHARLRWRPGRPDGRDRRRSDGGRRPCGRRDPRTARRQGSRPYGAVGTARRARHAPPQENDGRPVRRVRRDARRRRHARGSSRSTRGRSSAITASPSRSTTSIRSTIR